MKLSRYALISLALLVLAVPLAANEADSVAGTYGEAPDPPET